MEVETVATTTAPAWISQLEHGSYVAPGGEIKKTLMSEQYYVLLGDEPLDLACAGKTTEPAKSALLPLPDAIQWYVVIGRNGCTVRGGAELETKLVAEVARGTKMAAEAAHASFAQNSTGAVRLRVVRPEVGWVSLKLLMECETPASDESARKRAVVHDVEGEAAATERAASDRARKLRADFLSVRCEPRLEAEVVGVVRRSRQKVRVVELVGPPRFAAGCARHEASASWARVAEPHAGWVPLAALEVDNVCANRYRLNDPASLGRPPNIVPHALRGDGTTKRAPIRAACLHEAGSSRASFASDEMGGIGAFMRRTNQMTLVFGQGPFGLVPGFDTETELVDASTHSHDPASDRYAWLAHARALADPREARARTLASPPLHTRARAFSLSLSLSHALAEVDASRASARSESRSRFALESAFARVGENSAASRDSQSGRVEYMVEGVARGLASLIHFLADEGVKWREDRLHGCRFAVAHGQAADLMTIFWAFSVSGHLHDALKGCGEESSGFPRCMHDRSHYVKPEECWFSPIAGVLVGGGDWGWSQQLDACGPQLAVAVRRQLTQAGRDQTADELGYKLKYGVDRHGQVKTLFTRGRVEQPTLHVVGKSHAYRADAERLYSLYSDASRRLMYHGGGAEMPEGEYFGAEVARFVARAMMEDAGTTYDHGIPGVAA